MTSPRSDVGNSKTPSSHTPALSSRFMVLSRFPPPSQPDTSSVSLVPGIAQGRPVPLNDANATNRAALRELSRSQPSTRSPCTKGSSPPPSTTSTTSTTTGTYSQPVLVRTYSGPLSPSAQTRSFPYWNGVSSVPSRPNASSASSSADRRRRARRSILPVSVIHHPGKTPLSSDDIKLPPLEAFTFKSIMAEIEPSISADLDRIADICARSRYSLSNQYEIHMAPHGSGSSYIAASPASMSAGPLRHDRGGPTLQTIPLDDTSARRGKEARVGQRSVAYGTLETIMSSSRSSEEDRGKKQSAAEIVAQVRGHIQQVGLGDSTRENACSIEARSSSDLHDKRTNNPPRSRPTLAAAILNHSRINYRPDPPPRSLWISGATLVGDPAVPETSHNHLVSGTTPRVLSHSQENDGFSTKEQTSLSVSKAPSTAAVTTSEASRDPHGLLGKFRFSIPWKDTPTAELHRAKPQNGKAGSYAAGTLKQLLKVAVLSGSGGGKFIDEAGRRTE